MNTATDTSISTYENERIVLGCMLNNQDDCKLGTKHLREYDFESSIHKIIFKSLAQLQIEEGATDVHLLCEELKTQGKLDEVGGVPAIIEIAQMVGTSSHFEWYMDLLIQQASRRNLYETINKQHKAPLEKLFDTLKTQQEKYQSRQSSIAPLYQYLLEPSSEKEVVEEIKNTSEGIRIGLKIGEIDLKILGGQISIVAGPTSHGKTSFLINMALGALRSNSNKSVYFFSYEESKSSITSLFLNTYIDKDISKNNRESIRTPAKS